MLVTAVRLRSHLLCRISSTGHSPFTKQPILCNVLAEMSPRGLNSWNSYTQHLRCFTHGMGAAIRSITQLEIDTESMGSDTVERVAGMLSLLPPAIPALQHLQLAGNIGRGLLVAFGAACSNIFRLTVADGVSCEPLAQLHLLIPGLTHCKVQAPPTTGDWLPQIASCCLPLLSCTSLTSVDVGHCTLPLEVWHALPPGLSKLHCAVAPEPLAGLRLMESLHHFSCHCTFTGNLVEMCSLVAVLRVTPALVSLSVDGWGSESERSSFLSEVYLTCAAASVPDLVFFNARVTSGLVVTSTWCAGGASQGVNLSLSLWADNAEYGDITEFLAILPPLTAITGLILCSNLLRHSMTLVSRGIAAVFPNITALVLELPESISTKDLTHLGSFTALQHLSLRDAEVTPASLAMLCSRLLALRELRLEGCGEFSDADGDSLQHLLHDWGSHTNVMIVSRERID